MTPEQLAEAAEMGLTPEEYREREKRWDDFQPRVVAHIDLDDEDIPLLDPPDQ